MPRPTLVPGTYGSITTWQTAAGTWRARVRYRDADGVTRDVVRHARTGPAAERTLKAALRDRQRAGGLGITADMPVAELVAEWLARVERSDLAVGTKQQYAKIAKAYVVPALGALKVGEVRVAICDTALHTIHTRHGYSVAKSARAVMSGVFGLAVRQDALAGNPVRDVDKLRRDATKKAKALTVKQSEDLRDRLRSIDRAIDLDLPDLAEFMLMTGARIGEALACREDLNAEGLPLLDLDAGTWEVSATVVRVKGVGLVLQEKPKTAAGWRVLALPPAAVGMLRRRRGELRLRRKTVQLLDPAGEVRTGHPAIMFPSPSARALRDPNNTQGDLREILDGIDCPVCDGTGYQRDPAGRFILNDRGRRIRCAAGPWSWVTSRTFRKTVATRLEEAGLTPRQIADQLGHSKVSMTQDVYFGRGVVVADAARILDR